MRRIDLRPLLASELWLLPNPTPDNLVTFFRQLRSLHSLNEVGSLYSHMLLLHDLPSLVSEVQLRQGLVDVENPRVATGPEQTVLVPFYLVQPVSVVYDE